MKKIIVLFMLLCGVAFSQTAYLTEADSILAKTSMYKGTFSILAVTDSSNTFTDSLIVEVQVHDVWVAVGVQSYSDRFGAWVTTIVPGDGNTRLYVVNYPTLNDLRVRRTNVTNLTVRTRVSWFSLTNY